MKASHTSDFIAGQTTPARHRVVIVGCGFGGLFATRALIRADVEVTVIDRNNHHLFQPLLYQLATGILSEGDIAPPIRDILRHQRNATVLLGEVKNIDLQHRSLTVDTLGLYSEVLYDSLILATGASQSYFGHPEFARHAPAASDSRSAISNAPKIRLRSSSALSIVFMIAVDSTEARLKLAREYGADDVVSSGPEAANQRRVAHVRRGGRRSSHSSRLSANALRSSRPIDAVW